MDVKLFEIQPDWCRKPVTVHPDILNKLHPNLKRLVLFDPNNIYQIINDENLINPYQRYNSLNIEKLFKNVNNTCACGCGKELKGRQRRWANEECRIFGANVLFIISGHTHMKSLYENIFDSDCVSCKKTERETKSRHELDHIYPVKFGGAGGWFSNYEFKCKKCHREKTNKDFNFKDFSNKVIQKNNQISIEWNDTIDMK